jgi:hypothetical protein
LLARLRPDKSVSDVLRTLQAGLRAKPRPAAQRAQLEAQLARLAKGQFLRGIISYDVTHPNNRLQFEFTIDKSLPRWRTNSAFASS